MVAGVHNGPQYVLFADQLEFHCEVYDTGTWSEVTGLYIKKLVYIASNLTKFGLRAYCINNGQLKIAGADV